MWIFAIKNSSIRFYLIKITIAINFRWVSYGPGITWSVANGSRYPPRLAMNYFRKKSYRIFDISVPTETTDSNCFGKAVGS